jgi:hypothetical protein
MHIIDRVVSEVDRAADESVRFTSDLVRIPTVNPPGAEYETAARFMGDWLSDHGYAVEYFAAEERPEHSRAYPRLNVVGRRTVRSFTSTAMSTSCRQVTGGPSNRSAASSAMAASSAAGCAT